MKEFEDILSAVGGCGKFQRRLLYLVFGPVFLLLPLSWMNEIFLLQVPEHWCSHPNLEHLNPKDLIEWKDCFLPDQLKADGTQGYDGCHILVPTDVAPGQFWLQGHWDKALCPKNGTQISRQEPCAQGWSFDQTDFTRTAASENSWVCGDGSRVPDLFTFGSFGGIVGTFIFSYASDRFGRRFVFWITTSLVMVSMSIKTFFAHNYALYAGLKFVAAASYVAVYQVPFTIITEVSSPEYRSWAIGVSCVAWTTGACILPLIAWLSGDWVHISLITTIPMLVLYLGWNFVPESPRWALSRNKVQQAEATIRQIAKVNGVKNVRELTSHLNSVAEKMQAEPSYGYLSLFTRPHLAKKTIFLALASVGSNFLYYSLMLNVSNMSGNTFLNFFLLSVIEFPGILVSIWMLENVGRRWGHVLILFINFLCLAFTGIIAAMPALSNVVIAFCLIAKFNCSISFTILYVQTIEIFPTCVRNSGMGFTTVFASMVGMFGPHVVHLGTVDARIPYAIMAGIALIGSLAASYLPETRGTDLPETLEEAEEFGKKDRYFQWAKAADGAEVEHLRAL